MKGKITSIFSDIYLGMNLSILLCIHSWSPAIAQDIELIERGSEPYRVLRFEPSQAVEKARMELNMSVSLRGPGATRNTVSMPKLIANLELKAQPQKATTAAEIAFSTSYTSFAVQPIGKEPSGMVTGLQDSLDALSGLECLSRMTRSGRVLVFNCKAARALAPETQQMLLQLQKGMQENVIPLPKVAVGAGARWKVSSMQGEDISKTTLYAIRKLYEHGAEVAVEVKAHSAEKKKSVPNKPGSFVLVQSVLTSSGTVLVNTQRLISKSNSRIVAEDISRPLGQRSDLALTNRIEVNVEVHPVS